MLHQIKTEEFLAVTVNTLAILHQLDEVDDLSVKIKITDAIKNIIKALETASDLEVVTKKPSQKEVILRTLSGRQYGVTLTTLAREAGCSKQSAACYLSELRKKGYKIKTILTGRSKRKFKLMKRGA